MVGHLMLALRLACLAAPSAASNTTTITAAAAHFGAANPLALASALAEHALGPALTDLASLDVTEQAELGGAVEATVYFLSGVSFCEGIKYSCQWSVQVLMLDGNMYILYLTIYSCARDLAFGLTPRTPHPGTGPLF